MLKNPILLLLCAFILGCAQGCTVSGSCPANANAASGAATPTCAAPSLRAELLAMVEKDQAVRRMLIAAGADRPEKSLLEKVMAVDEANTARIKEIVAARGVPRDGQARLLP